ncbi:MAG: D-glycero-alpha-D-manno-heptose-1,7-bisphosphate 7-phosphatase [Planctomycetota bacterium]
MPQPTNKAGRPAVFVDRDGTINANPTHGDFVTRPGDLRLLPGSAEALRRLKEAGYLVVVFTNQSGVGRGVMTAADVEVVNAHLGDVLAEGGASLDGVYFCPHVNEDGCECRKPKPGLLTRAAEELGIDLSRSWGVGDGARDLEAARAAGCRVVLVHGDSYPGQREAGEALSPEASVPDLAAAVDVVLRDGR